MAGSEDERAESRFYRSRPGVGWLVAFLAGGAQPPTGWPIKGNESQRDTT